jgi:hypothetical protein
MAKGDVLVRMKADVSNYDANIAKARRQLENFKKDNLSLGGIINQSTKSLVAAAAQYASFAAVIGTVASGFAEATNKGIAMAREAEGVSKAFERLNQPGLLDNLREATHNTVNDLELMKQAVKFDNFNLSLEQMGTFLAFAQQQAKDTGQDVNYLVDSIVTGLGRKSLPILDNLGLSATEIRERMKETGDMTQAVADIIQERMEAAGGYVETAADRAAQAQARLDNAMKELGDTMNSLSGSGATLWSELEIGAVNLANNTIKPLIKLFNELAKYIQGTSVEDILTNGMTDVTDTVDDNGKLIKKNAINNIPEIVVSGHAPKKTKRPRGGGRSGGGKTMTVKTEEQLNNEEIQKLTQEYIKASDERRKAIEGEIKTLQDRNAEIKRLMEAAQGKIAPDGSKKALSEELSKLQLEGQLLSDPIDIELNDQAIKDVQDEIDRLNGKKVEVELEVDNRTPFEKLRDSLKIEIAEENMQVDTTTLQTLMKTAMQNGIDGLDPQFASLQEKMREGMNIPDSAWEDLQTQINEKLKELGIEPIKIDFKTGNISNGKQENMTAKAMEKFNGDFSKVTGGVSSIVSGIQQMGVDIPNEIQNIFGVLSGISTIMTGITAILTLIEIDTKTTAAASVTDALIPFARGGIVPHAANGYFVPGNNYSGDVTPIMANAGELVLNKAQQSTLASELQNGGNRIQVVGRLSGEQLFLCAENWSKRTGKGEFVTW